jgi:hypothetical protein
MRFPGGRTIAAFLALLLLLASLIPPSAEAKTFFTVRRMFSVLFLGGSGYLALKAWDYRRDANGLYDQYKKATTSEQATTLFKRTSDRDTKSQISIALSAALLVAGLRLILSGESEKQGEEPAKLVHKFNFDLRGRPEQKALRVEIRRNF